MRTGARDKSGAIERIRRRLAADKKKTVTAICLVGIMAFMWGKLLLKKGPADAAADTNAGQTAGSQEANEQPKVSYVELPHISGRHDAITRDFFSPAGWRGFGIDTEVGNLTDRNDREVVSDSSSEEIVARIAGGLELQAIQDGGQPQALACINGQPVEVGAIVKVDSGDDMHEFEVVEIEENRVSLRYGEVKFNLKLEGALK